MIALAGWDAKNNRLFADKLAAGGLIVALPGAAKSRSIFPKRRQCMHGMLFQAVLTPPLCMPALLHHFLSVQHRRNYSVGPDSIRSATELCGRQGGHVDS